MPQRNSGGQTTKVYQTVSAMNGVVMSMLAVLVLASLVSLSSERGVAQDAAEQYQKLEAPGGSTGNWKFMRGAVARVLTKIIAFAFIIRVQYKSPKLLGVEEEQKWNVSLRDDNGIAICNQCVMQAVDTAAACETMRLLSWIWGIGFSIVANALIVAQWATLPFLAMTMRVSYPVVSEGPKEADATTSLINGQERTDSQEMEEVLSQYK
eukprot:g32449.t1